MTAEIPPGKHADAAQLRIGAIGRRTRRTRRKRRKKRRSAPFHPSFTYVCLRQDSAVLLPYVASTGLR